MKLKAIKIISIILFIMLSITMIFYIVNAEDQNVTLTLTPKPKIDIVLAKAKTSLDLKNFESDIKEKLINEGIDTDDVRVSALEAKQEVFTTSFDWDKDLSTVIGDIKITNGGRDVEMIGNHSEPGKNAMWIIPDKQNQDQKFTFNYNIDFGDSFNAAGMLLKVKDSGNTLTGYMLSFNKSSKDWYSGSGNYNGAIWEFSYTKGANTSNVETKILKKGLDILTEGTLTVETTDTQIKVSGGGLSGTVTYNTEKEFGNGYGFFSDHYSHGCDEFGSFKLTNINLQTESVKTFNEVLRGADWRDGAYKFLVDVDEKENEELASSSTYGELATRLMNEGIYFVAWGSSKNQTQFENLIKTNDNKGKFIINAGYTSNLEQTAKYIKSVLGTLQSSYYLIVNEPIKIGVDPPGILTGTIDDQWTTGKWMVKHDYEYYENNMGQFAQSNMYTDDFITTFDKVGKYEITYKNVPITPSEIYVHRRPVALFDMSIEDTNVTLIDKSYDLDKESQDNGIKERQWKWKETTETNWHDGQLTTIDKTKEYIVQLSVKDFQDTWSIPCNKYINLKLNNIKPIATFDFKNSEITPYDKLQITDNSYDPAGKKITTRKWEVFDKNNVSKYNSTTQKENYTDLTPGQYRMSLTVTNESGTQSETFSRYFTIIADSIAPEFVANPIESDWTKGVTVDLEFNDPGLSGFKNYKYEITTSQDTPSQYSNQSTNAKDQITLDGTGIKYIHIITEDIAGNISADRIIGAYKLDNEPPDITVTADLQNTVVDKLQVNIKTEDPHSGMKSLKLDGNDLKDINNDTIEILKNGTYTITAEDKLGNTSTKQIQVNNINYTCNAGLGHPDYSSSLDECPICKLLEGVRVTNHEAVYDKTEKTLTYDNPNEAEIIEYYNGSTQKPIEEGSYTYVLKIKYNGTEYNTGISGTYTIHPKPITITSISAQDRQYNKTDIINISGGRLVGLEQGDEVGFVLPQTGKSVDVSEGQNTPAIEVGTHNVRIDTITLNGAQSHNYKLIQPNVTDVSVNITNKQLTIVDIIAQDRQYNKTDIINISGGRLVGVEEGDEVGFVLPETGKSVDVVDGQNTPAIEVGTHNVQIDTITLNGAQSHDYVLTQPQVTDVSVTIIQKEITIKDIVAHNRPYNKTDVIQLSGGQLVGVEEGDEVGFVLPETGQSVDVEGDQITPAIQVGTHNVQIDTITLNGAQSHNYKLIQPQVTDVSVNITNKELTIVDIIAQDRQYNKTDVIQLSGGKLVGIEQGDKVEFVLPEIGQSVDIIENQDISAPNVGEHYVKIEEIKLIGENASEYTLIQPQITEVKVTITPKDINITEIKAEDREYDKTNVVKINGGKLIGLEEGDEVGYVLPETGTIDDVKIGKYNVHIPEIKLIGAQAYNYNLIAPLFEDVTVTITQRKIKLTDLKAIDKKYDKNAVVKLKGETFDRAIEDDDVKAIIPETGIAESANVGQWKVGMKEITIEGADSENYLIIQPEYGEILVNIFDPEEPFIHIESDVVTLNENEIKISEPQVDEDGNVIYKTNKKAIDVRYGDIIELQISAYNQGTGAGYVNEIQVELPEGLEMTDTETNKVNKWKTTKDNICTTTKLSFDGGVKNEIPGMHDNILSKKSIILECKVTTKDINTQELIINTKATQSDTINQTIEYNEQKEEQNTVQDENVVQNEDTVQDENIIEQKETTEIYSKSETKLNVKYTDFSISTRVKHIYNQTIGQEIPSNSEPNTITKFEIHRKQIAQTKIQVIYEIAVENKGNSEGEVDKVIDYLPQGLQFQESQNPEWILTEPSTIETTEFGTIKPGETKTKEIIPNWDMSQTAGTKENKVVLTSTHDIDQRTIYADPNKTIENNEITGQLLKTNNSSQTTVIGSVKTGIHVYITIAASLLLLILLPIVYFIKRKRNNLS